VVEPGYRRVPHTADVRIEAWAPTREECVERAVVAMVDGFVELPGEPAGAVEARFRVPSAADPDLLTRVLDEVIYRMDTAGEVPVGVAVAAAPDGGLAVRLRVVDAGQVQVVGAVPKAVSLHELRFGPDQDGWSCRFTVDV
jgi:SHS2 domain-containing protein